MARPLEFVSEPLSPVRSTWIKGQVHVNGILPSAALTPCLPGLAHLPNYFSASSHLETKDFVGLIIWMCAFIPAVLIRPERLQIPFAVCFVLFCCTAFGLLIW